MIFDALVNDGQRLVGNRELAANCLSAREDNIAESKD